MYNRLYVDIYTYSALVFSAAGWCIGSYLYLRMFFFLSWIFFAPVVLRVEISQHIISS